MENIRLDVNPVGEFQMNSILVTATGSTGKESLLIDPGADPVRLREIIAAANAPLVAMAATHGHFDHVGAAADLQETWPLPLLCHENDQAMIRSMPQIQATYGFPPSAIPELKPSLTDGSILMLAGHEIKVRHVPGHSPGQVMFLLPGYALVGDCIFQGSVGRTDLPGGNFEVLQKSIRERIYTLPDETVIICGHGPNTTVGQEKATNPFVQG